MSKSRLNTLFLVLLLIGCFIVPQSAEASDQMLTSSTVMAGQTAEYEIHVINNDPRLHSYRLAASGLPTGFMAVFYCDDKSIDKLQLKPLGTADITLRVTMPINNGRSCQFTADLVRDDGHKSSFPCNLTLDNSYRLQITNQITNLQVMSGQDVSFQVTVTNAGSKDLKNVNLALELPYKWQVSVSPQIMSQLKPGNNATFAVKITVPSSQDASNQKVIMTARADEATAPGITVPIMVQKSPRYLIWPGVVIGLLSIIVIWKFKKTGRR